MERQSLLTKFPKYDELAKQVRKLRDDLAAAPLVADAPAAQKKQAEALAEISKLSGQQEALLREIALRREAADMVFPPMHATKDVQASLPPRQLMLIFFSTSNSTHAWLISKERYALWKVEAPSVLEKRIGVLLKAMGNFDGNAPSAADPARRGELAAGGPRFDRRLDLEFQIRRDEVNLSDNIDELIVVPDGPLWYLPFECLQVARPAPTRRSDRATVRIVFP